MTAIGSEAPTRWPLDEASWRDRLRRDAAAIGTYLPAELRSLHRAVVTRTRAAGAAGLILTGSTARGRRTAISDVDYHLVGPKIATHDLSLALDLHVLSAAGLEEAILSGDDFVQWSLRFGHIVLDDGVLREGLRTIVERRPWPDPERKRLHAAKSLELAGRVVATGDVDGGVEQVRTALSLAARAFLLAAGTFPLSRAELPDQLAAVGHETAGQFLRSTITGELTMDELAAAVGAAQDLLDDMRMPTARRRVG